MRDSDEFTEVEERLLSDYVTNVDRRVFALKNLPEVVKGALFSRYSRSERSLRRVLLDEFLKAGDSRILPTLPRAHGRTSDIDVQRAEKFYERVLVGYGDDSVAELAGAHLALEDVSLLGAKALEESRIGLSPLEKSTRYVRFDIPDGDGHYRFYRNSDLDHPAYHKAANGLFSAYALLLPRVIEAVRNVYQRDQGESERAWLSATKARSLDLIRGLLPAGTLTNVGIYGNGRAFEYLITKLLASPLPECQRLATEMHGELSLIIPAFVRRSVDPNRGLAVAHRLAGAADRTAKLAPQGVVIQGGPTVTLLEFDPDGEARVAAACAFPYSNLPLAELRASGVDAKELLDAAMGNRESRRDRPPRALEHAFYTFELIANFGVYRDLQRHRMLTQERQILGVDLGYDVPPLLDQFGLGDELREAVDNAAIAYSELVGIVGPVLAQYVVPIAFRVRWYVKANLRELFHLCELRTTPQAHPDYRYLAQEMFRQVQSVHPLLASYAGFVNMDPSDELERRASERRVDEKLNELGNRTG